MTTDELQEDEVKRLVDDYVQWLRDKTTLRRMNGGWVEITTPHLDRHNDYLQIHVRHKDDHFLLSDRGHVLEDLEDSGCRLDDGRRRQLLDATLHGFGVELDNGELIVRASKEDFALRKHNLVQAMLAVNDLFCLAAATVASVFREDVSRWLDEKDVRYTPSVKFTGKSRFDHLFDFVIPRSRQRPERIIRAITRPSKDTVTALAFAWHDTREVRPENSVAYAILNDDEHAVRSSISDALRQYEITPVPWSRRREVEEDLAA